ncbi:hypothetical protein PaeBR_02035 [Paenibacillus sp. BR2-3]|uniref:hypothetical protein n=1 Tax=Paenibacillus sp. BR2-3 TaxID=3048494 RepID=UPI0039773EE3
MATSTVNNVKSTTVTVSKTVNSAVNTVSEKAKNITAAEAVNGFQTVLDVAGLIPGAGELADGANALIYLAKREKANAALSAAAMIPGIGSLGTVGKLLGKGKGMLDEGVEMAAHLGDDVRVVNKAMVNSVPTKPGGGSNPNDFVNPHSEKHMFDPSRPSTPNRSQYGQDVEVGKLRQETMTNPDKAYSNWPNPNNPNTQRITKYYKEFDGNISTPDTPTGSHRVFENLDDPTRSSHFPYVPKK